jgi:hypothetical protein
VVFPTVGITSAGNRGAIVYSLTGNRYFPSVAVSKVSSSTQVTSIPVVLAGQDVLEDFSWLIIGRPRFGDYSAAVGDGAYVYLAGEYIQYPSCSDAHYVADPTCGGTRAASTNWGTGFVKLNV